LKFTHHTLGQTLRSMDLMTHHIEVTDVDDRRQWFSELCAGRSVLHIGCCDVPIFDPNTNLHIFLAKHTDRLDGLDISEPDIAVLRRHVDGLYFTNPADVTREYDIVLVPEVLEHTSNPGAFLTDLFSVPAEKYLITAPHIQWYKQSSREGNVFHESVHEDHKAWYSPYTLLNTLRPFIREEHDKVEVFLLKTTGSVAVLLTKSVTPKPFQGREPEEVLSVAAALERARAYAAKSRDAAALRVLEAAQKATDDGVLVYAQLELLLGLGQTMEVLRRSVVWMRSHPKDLRCRELCANAMEALGDVEGARKLRSGSVEDDS